MSVNPNDHEVTTPDEIIAALRAALATADAERDRLVERIAQRDAELLEWARRYDDAVQPLQRRCHALVVQAEALAADNAALRRALEDTKKRVTEIRYRTASCPFCGSSPHRSDCALIPLLDGIAAALQAPAPSGGTICSTPFCGGDAALEGGPVCHDCRGFLMRNRTAPGGGAVSELIAAVNALDTALANCRWRDDMTVLAAQEDVFRKARAVRDAPGRPQ